jgi:hypothetical protein
MDESDVAAIQKAIEALAFTHRRRPFGILRETGVAGELKRWADQFLWGRNFTNATVVNMPQGEMGPTVDTDRVRLEAGVLLPPENPGDPVNPEFVLDLVLYKTAGVFLNRHVAGPGDVVLKTNPESILAAVEIKASPSSRQDQKLAYASDIKRLLDLRRRYQIATFFVLLDKSSNLYRNATDLFAPVQTINWPSNEPMTLTDVVYGNHPNAQQNQLWNDIHISPIPPDYSEFVEIWNVSASDAAEVKLYAYYVQAV